MLRDDRGRRPLGVSLSTTPGKTCNSLGIDAPGNAQTFISRLSYTLGKRSVMLSEINMKAVASHHHERMRWVVVAPQNLT